MASILQSSYFEFRPTAPLHQNSVMWNVEAVRRNRKLWHGFPHCCITNESTEDGSRTLCVECFASQKECCFSLPAMTPVLCCKCLSVVCYGTQSASLSFSLSHFGFWYVAPVRYLILWGKFPDLFLAFVLYEVTIYQGHQSTWELYTSVLIFLHNATLNKSHVASGIAANMCP